MSTEHPRWFTSSYSGNGGQCVEVAVNLVATHGTVPVRDSKRTSGPVLDFRSVAFSSFVAGIKIGEFDTV
ncbi:DUF397 domain-containing protein [Streptomyces acidiscabies]|uniref:DUF397 domain-containing protein n=1 Tax=Streptomyces acidiscabies TaxID=42234 RepID=A0AAP6EE49_9ACTN|nr:DUF397 domain-containing protein [Streptomyces acidiscabies]MBP5939687.1 DUF397 domain-containing protein [Streptomyces sp. LBUM 1476]MBZ3910861.1 DUF397 domain-containing protein [Streptomyces acidiscabies]MDX2959359.1 DUF397 domain-containing protein [Streptomyces acidiscabies]MDX3017497.1 DUF397 domain-containing protein [Streptomyces acidiscabies]MDX3787973.1 DUF397 domain-containing protein [Streptomyces acidiscabies]